jgi:hypothetical protein
MKPKLAMIGAIIAASLFSIRTNWSHAQQVNPGDPFVPRARAAAAPANEQSPHEVDGFLMEKIVRRRRASGEVGNRDKLREVQNLASELKSANEPDSKVDEKQKAELAKKLETAVGALFDSDLAEREQQLAQVEQQLKNLRTVLDRRRQAKAEIIQLEVKVLTNEAAGLGFSASEPFRSGKGRFGLEILKRHDFQPEERPMGSYYGSEQAR